MNNQRRAFWVHVTVVLGILIATGWVAAPALAQGSAAERAASLRAQLAEVEDRQAELQTRLQQLDEQLNPQNIERSLAGIGSVHPEDLREERRRQLEIEKRGVQTQLDTLNANHTRLETAIARADTESYWQSAGITSTGASNQSPPTRSSTRRHRRRR